MLKESSWIQSSFSLSLGTTLFGQQQPALLCSNILFRFSHHFKELSKTIVKNGSSNQNYSNRTGHRIQILQVYATTGACLLGFFAEFEFLLGIESCSSVVADDTLDVFIC